jgi:hypothetical protein
MTYAIDPAPGHERDALDALLSGLLDIQDDIAQAVMWLAENWSADLPAPGWMGRSSDRDETQGPVLRLPMCCSLDELSRVAELTGTTPVDDETPNCRGDRYRRVRRSFGAGRVELEAFHPLGRETDR